MQVQPASPTPGRWLFYLYRRNGATGEQSYKELAMLVPRFKNRHRLARLTDEVTALRAEIAAHRVISEAKDSAQREWVGMRIAQWNAAIRATNGPRRGESQESYQRRLVEANRG